MSHYEQRLEHDLEIMQQQVQALGRSVGEAVQRAVQALLGGDERLASSVILGDLPINRASRQLDRDAHAFVARHLPSAGHLRFVSSVLRLSIALERIGDYAVTIAREAVQLESEIPLTVRRDIELVGEQVRKILAQALEAFEKSDAQMAKTVKAMAGQVATTFDHVFQDLVDEGGRGKRSIEDLFALLLVFNRLERVADQSKNICEEAMFAATGEMKKPKVYRVLFVDRANDLRSKLAELYARKAYPNSGQYESCGWEPADTINPQLEAFLGEHGYEPDGRPAALASLADKLGDYDVIVAVEPEAREHLGAIPYHTAVVDWDFVPVPQPLDRERSAALLAEDSKTIALKVRELIETLRGEHAD